MTKRIAMWSGPRNLSTAMMYSFAARSDCRVVDEPFYGAYLDVTGAGHPLRERVLASQPVDPDKVVDAILGPVDAPVFYQKHMAHHMVDGFPLDWMDAMVNVFLIRHPERVVASYARKREGPTLDDLGFRQQVALFRRVKNPIVIDATDIRADPEKMLQALCSAIGIPWDPSMLSWPAGGHPADGVWAAHWYGAVHRSTGFEPAEAELPRLETVYADLAEAALPFYAELSRAKIT